MGGCFLPGYYQLYRALELVCKWCVRGHRSRQLHIRSRFIISQMHKPLALTMIQDLSQLHSPPLATYSKDCHQERPMLKIKCHNNISIDFGFLNIQLLHNKLKGTLELRKERSLDVICLIESWDDINSVFVYRLQAAGYNVCVLSYIWMKILLVQITVASSSFSSIHVSTRFFRAGHLQTWIWCHQLHILWRDAWLIWLQVTTAELLYIASDLVLSSIQQGFDHYPLSCT